MTWPFIIFLLLTTLLFIVLPSAIAIILGGQTLPILIAVLPTFGCWILTILYQRWDWLYFQVNRWSMWLRNKEVVWSLRVEWGGYDVSQPVVQQAFDTLVGRFPNAIVRRREPFDTSVELPGYTVHLSERYEPPQFGIGELDSGRVLSLAVSELIVPFRASHRILEQQLLPLLELIRTTLIPQDEKYSLKVRFGEHNPYFGFYLQRIRLPQIVTFQCEFIDERADGDRISVGKDQLTIVSQSLMAMGTLARKYLALAPPG